jgi:hypothetical protein
MDKNSSVLQKSVNYSRKKVYSTGSRTKKMNEQNIGKVMDWKK